MILSDNDIMDALDGKAIKIDPHPDPEQIQPASLDLRFGGQVYNVWEDREFDVDEDGSFSFQPGEFYLGTTQEKVYLPRYLVGVMAGRSTFAREGLIVHLQAGYVDPGWKGQLTLEIVNFNCDPVTVGVGERIVQIAFLETKSKSSGYQGQYQGQEGPTLSRRSEK